MKSKRSTGRIVVGTLLIVTGLYLVCFAGLVIFQRHLLYYPCRASYERLSEQAHSAGFKPWLNPGGSLVGWFRLSETNSTKRQILLLHGNAGCAPDWSHYADAFCAFEPCDFYILEYPGYGTRRGLLNQASILRAAEEAFNCLPETCRVYLVGESLGTGVTAWLAGQHDGKVGGIFLVAPYVNLTAVGQSHLPLFPVKLMLKDKYPADQWLARYHGPVAVLLASQDEVIPSRFGRQLYEGYPGPKKLWIEPAASHDDVHRPRKEIVGEVLSFWGKSSP